jgi:(p)ppGpp synthase/HD superfamily hydrolase
MKRNYTNGKRARHTLPKPKDPAYSMLHRAVGLAAKALDGKVDDTGEPVLLHALRVVDRLDTEDEWVVAILQEAVNGSSSANGGSPLTQIRREFPRRVVEALELLRDDGSELEAQVKRVACNRLATIVKVAALGDHCDRTASKISRMVERYKDARRSLIAATRCFDRRGDE